MTTPRIRLVGLMAMVGLWAVDLAVMRYVLDDRGRMLLALTLSVLPMTNVLAVLAYRTATRRDLQPFAVGFAAFGAAAMLAHVALDRTYPEQMIRAYDIPNAPFVSFCMAHVPWSFSPDVNGHPKYFRYAPVLAIPYSLPQFIVATLGGLIVGYLTGPRRAGVLNPSRLASRSA